MPGAIFNINLIPQAGVNAQGQETVVFEMSSNPGHPPQSLQKVASGGELSRISLAIELILHQFLDSISYLYYQINKLHHLFLLLKKHFSNIKKRPIYSYVFIKLLSTFKI